eukprot:scaffold24385_cov101-Isochrysis_galbana.AAC.2
MSARPPAAAPKPKNRGSSASGARRAQIPGRSANSRPRIACAKIPARSELRTSPEIAVRLFTSSSAASRAASCAAATPAAPSPPPPAPDGAAPDACIGAPTGSGTAARTASAPTSSAKKTPASGALNPAETPAAAPAARSCRLRCNGMPRTAAMRRETLTPISTAGPSGPSELPVHNVATAAAVRPAEAAGRKAMPRSFSATCSASPGPSRQCGSRHRIAETRSPPRMGTAHSPRDRERNPRPWVVSSP